MSGAAVRGRALKYCLQAELQLTDQTHEIGESRQLKFSSIIVIEKEWSTSKRKLVQKRPTTFVKCTHVRAETEKVFVYNRLLPNH